MDKQVAEIVWMPYPECLKQLEQAPKDAQCLLSWELDSGEKQITKHSAWELFNPGISRKHAKAVSLYPSPFDPEAKQVNFQTAMLWMQEGLQIISDVSGCVYNLDIDGIVECHFADGTSNTDELFSYAEIQGLWERTQ